MISGGKHRRSAPGGAETNPDSMPPSRKSS